MNRKRRKRSHLSGTAVIALIVFAAASFILQAQDRAASSGEDKPPVETAAAVKSNPLLAGKTIVLDAGHGGEDAGSIGQKGTFEKEVTLDTVHHIRDELKERTGADVVLTRQEDEFVPLEQRAAMAGENNADLFISIHYDAFESKDVAGMTTYYYHNSDLTLAEVMHDALLGGVDVKDRGVKEGNYQVLRENVKPALLLELGYISNKAEEERMNSEAFQTAVSHAIVNGIIDYLS
ncbi:N-acetylmuramoyl-L-alanine amidase family protein [Paenibacillus montanisoli]|uniref:N-acetylmuramoyl-L-alanine amidase n=1 Tax=Paenibacillus montanisoli TaxID=2081970 RepID=A0A328U731_9BACL|nr:N-acetylmuramoyl-L-alanine amidase [Paenibacillus montanisoli]RAP78369.1 N-acetylmuramoyl-L-alanine amidase [Paenibacillus montanisoli]